ncbi:MAG: hypothetical protein SPK83_05585, partial [Succinivibrio dextrinosolvens]|nr:hypothetical protein [Succinivibrio dextrinosolvens]
HLQHIKERSNLIIGLDTADNHKDGRHDTVLRGGRLFYSSQVKIICFLKKPLSKGWGHRIN